MKEDTQKITNQLKDLKKRNILENTILGTTSTISKEKISFEDIVQYMKEKGNSVCIIDPENSGGIDTLLQIIKL